jgi:cyclopropane-fatty-acyl-phospholipid synthase
MTYSCALFESPELSLREAQEAKLDSVCRKLELEPDDHVVELGTGWGSFALHAAGRYGCRVTTTTISQEQHAVAVERVREAGLEERVTVLLQDYRDLRGRFDKLVSIEMIEAVGHEYLPQYFAICARLLRPAGRFALQSITMPDARFSAYRRRVDWMQTYVFPGSLIPSLGAIAHAAAPAGFRIERADDLGPDYATTLRMWRERFVAALPEVVKLGFDQPFIRTWLMYLAFSEAAFAEHTLGDHQILLTLPGGLPAPAGE